MHFMHAAKLPQDSKYLDTRVRVENTWSKDAVMAEGSRMLARTLQSACRDFEEILHGPRDDAADSERAAFLHGIPCS